MSTELWRQSATELAGRIARRETSALAATESVLARIAQVNPQVQALATVSADSALAAARAADMNLRACFRWPSCSTTPCVAGSSAA